MKKDEVPRTFATNLLMLLANAISRALQSLKWHINNMSKATVTTAIRLQFHVELQSDGRRVASNESRTIEIE